VNDEPRAAGFVCAALGAAVSGPVYRVHDVRMLMRAIPKATYQTPEQIADRIKERELEAALSPPGPARQSVEIAKLRAYADVKRWIESPKLNPGA
jgi:hypothetical protein